MPLNKTRQVLKVLIPTSY